MEVSAKKDETQGKLGRHGTYLTSIISLFGPSVGQAAGGIPPLVGYKCNKEYAIFKKKKNKLGIHVKGLKHYWLLSGIKPTYLKRELRMNFVKPQLQSYIRDI